MTATIAVFQNQIGVTICLLCFPWSEEEVGGKSSISSLGRGEEKHFAAVLQKRLLCRAVAYKCVAHSFESHSMI